MGGPFSACAKAYAHRVIMYFRSILLTLRKHFSHHLSPFSLESGGSFSAVCKNFNYPFPLALYAQPAAAVSLSEQSARLPQLAGSTPMRVIVLFPKS